MDRAAPHRSVAVPSLLPTATWSIFVMGRERPVVFEGEGLLVVVEG